MSTTSIDVEKGESDEDIRTLLRSMNEGNPDDGGHSNPAGDIELDDFEKPGPSSSNIADDEVNTEEPNELEDSNLSENTNEESEDELQKLREKNTRLLKAIAMHNNKDVVSLLESGANPNATCPISFTSACHIAAFYNEKALRILLDAGAESRRFDSMGNTPLYYAACSDAPKKIAMILGFPEGLTNEITKVNHTLTPEQEAKIREIRARVNSLVDANGAMVDSDVQDKWITNVDVRKFGNYPCWKPGWSALHAASAYAHPQCVHLLLVVGANPNLLDKNNSTPLDVAGELSSDEYVQSYVETLQLLRKYDGKLSRVESLVLERALRKRSLPALTLLLDAGAPINYQNPSGYTPLHLCVELRLKEQLEVLINHSSPKMDYMPVNVRDEEGSTVLHWAARECWSDGVTVALLARADITHKNTMGDTALHLAAKNGNYDIVKQIIDHDTNEECDFSQENAEGESPFSNAICSGNADIVRLMLYKNRDMRVYLHRKVGDLTPLEYAAEKKFLELFILLLKEQNESLLNKDETFRIVNVISKHNLWELFPTFENHFKDSMKEIISENYTLHEAIIHNSREMICILLEKGADLSQRNKDGQTAMWLLMNHVTNPIELLIDLLNKCIKTNQIIDSEDNKCIPVITINYSLLMPVNEYEESDGDSDPLNTKAKDMKVLEALIETGHVYDQRSLLTHAVLQSFLYLKWKKYTKFIILLVSASVLFLISYNIFMASIYYQIDNQKTDKTDQVILDAFNPMFWLCTAVITCFPVCLVDLLMPLMSKFEVNKKKWYWYYSWEKMVTNLTMVWTMYIWYSLYVPKNILVLDALRISCVFNMCVSWVCLAMNLIWLPRLGNYISIYINVFLNIIKVMLSFLFPLVGFSVCFMILMRCKEHFSDPITAFLKTMVMMNSDLQYENLVKNITYIEEPENSTLSKLITFLSAFLYRSFFVLFFLFGTVFLMNVLAVNVKDLQQPLGYCRLSSFKKQVQCIIMLEKLFQHMPFGTFNLTKMKVEVEVTPDSKDFDKQMREFILNKIQTLKRIEEEKADDILKAKIFESILDLTKKQSNLEKELSAIRKLGNTIFASEMKPAKCESTRTRRVPCCRTKLFRKSKVK